MNRVNCKIPSFLASKQTSGAAVANFSLPREIHYSLCSGSQQSGFKFCPVTHQQCNCGHVTLPI